MSNLIIPDMSINDTYYGGYRTRTFANIFTDAGKFMTEFEASPFAAKIQPADPSSPAVDLELVFYLLYARYGNSHISFTDENQFRYNIFTTIFMYGPAWAVRLDTQKKIRELGDEIFLGSEATYNSALNPENAPGTDSREGLGYLNSQNKTLYTKSKLEGYANLLALVESDVTEDFLIKFRKFFLIVPEPDYPLLYETPEVSI